MRSQAQLAAGAVRKAAAQEKDRVDAMILDAERIRAELDEEKSKLAVHVEEAEDKSSQATTTLATAKEQVAEMLETAGREVEGTKAQTARRREEMRLERESVEEWRGQVENWRSQLDKERASLDGARASLDSDRAGISQAKAALAEGRRATEGQTAEMIAQAQAEADAIVERAWSEAERLVGQTDLDPNDAATTLAELRSQLEARDAELASRANELGLREEAAAEAEAQFQHGQTDFEAERTELIRSARDEGYEHGKAEGAATTPEQTASVTSIVDSLPPFEDADDEVGGTVTEIDFASSDELDSADSEVTGQDDTDGEPSDPTATTDEGEHQEADSED